jgi:hypothetical protein
MGEKADTDEMASSTDSGSGPTFSMTTMSSVQSRSDSLGAPSKAGGAQPNSIILVSSFNSTALQSIGASNNSTTLQPITTSNNSTIPIDGVPASSTSDSYIFATSVLCGFFSLVLLC